MEKCKLMLLLLVGLALITVDTVYAKGAASGRFIRVNSAGGVSGGSARGYVGAERSGGQARAFASDGQGNVAGGSARVYRGPNGQTAARGGELTRSADGSIQRKSGVAMSSQAGTVTSTGSYNRDAEGNANGQRSTSVVSQSGSQYQGSTSYSKETGVSHTGTCYDPNGNVVPCPGK